MGRRLWGSVANRGKWRIPVVDVCNLNALVTRESVKSGEKLQKWERERERAHKWHSRKITHTYYTCTCTYASYSRDLYLSCSVRVNNDRFLTVSNTEPMSLATPPGHTGLEYSKRRWASIVDIKYPGQWQWFITTSSTTCVWDTEFHITPVFYFISSHFFTHTHTHTHTH